MEKGNFRVDSVDLVHDIEYNYYGTRIATCGSDKKIRVYDYLEEDDTWELSAVWKAHNGSVLSISWAPPEYGNVLASSSLDRNVKIWVEYEERGSEKTVSRTWSCVATLSDSVMTVHKVAFAPEHIGLTLATPSSDGKVRFYSPSKLADLTNWSITSTLEASEYPMKDSDGPLSISWDESEFSRFQMVAVGINQPKEIKIFYYYKNKWAIAFELAQLNCDILDISWAPLMGRTYHLIACASEDGIIRIYQVWITLNSEVNQSALLSSIDETKSNPLIRDFIPSGNHANDTFQETGNSSFIIQNPSTLDSTPAEPNVNEPNNTNAPRTKENFQSQHEPPKALASNLEYSQASGDTGHSQSLNNNLNDSFIIKQNNVSSLPANHDGSPNSAPKEIPGDIGTQQHYPNEGYSKRISMDSLINDSKVFPGSFKIKLLSELNAHQGMPVRSVKWNAIGTVLLSCGDDSTVKIWQKQPDTTFPDCEYCNGATSLSGSTTGGLDPNSK
ncbi:hypothetical protein BB560_002123 [Smittium megazygosporum]|uniref:Anaphase-promoting complex subunit 4 WD40 domain-containing protein n=1 Tax=Smittium megazygosporum TaxID=133381 RepID=A0A2T9ZFP1_9FUNG|nr:hypothetical protein BB560_002123 [Smittium megazygosporum]